MYEEASFSYLFRRCYTEILKFFISEYEILYIFLKYVILWKKKRLNIFAK